MENFYYLTVLFCEFSTKPSVELPRKICLRVSITAARRSICEANQPRKRLFPRSGNERRAAAFRKSAPNEVSGRLTESLSAGSRDLQTAACEITPFAEKITAVSSGGSSLVGIPAFSAYSRNASHSLILSSVSGVDAVRLSFL